jgi:hypothetical protein
LGHYKRVSDLQKTGGEGKGFKWAQKVKCIFYRIDAHREAGEENLMYYKNWIIKMPKKNIYIGPLPDFLTTPCNPLKRILK